MSLFRTVLASLLILSAAHGQVSFESLLVEMTDRTRLARLAEPAYSCAQASSYDRESTSPDKPGWFANQDRSQFVRTEERDGKTLCVLMDESGPGAIVRFWATWHGPGGGPFTNGTLRVHLDHSEEPAIEGPIADLISGGALVGPPLSRAVTGGDDPDRKGHNLYLPIPYAEHCLVTYETSAPIDVGAREGEALYYQINYRTYEPGTSVRSFTKDTLERARLLFDATQRRLARSSLGLSKSKLHALNRTLAPDKEAKLEIVGPRAIQELTFKIDAEDLEQALRTTVLAIEFDGVRTVWVPVGDFFGIGHQRSSYQTYFSEVSLDGAMTVRWVMPFAVSAQIAITNYGKQEVRIAIGEVKSIPWRWDEKSMHFHARWRQYASVESDAVGRAARDLNYVSIRGTGTYVGDSLIVMNGAPAWWGEGDEKIWVDGESFPSHFGTGTEDYYGYAWARPEFFEAPFHAQPRGDGNQAGGYAANLRFRALDAIPFREQLRVDMEYWHWAETRSHFAPTTFFYALPGAEVNVTPDLHEAERPVPRTMEDVDPPAFVRGAIEGESLPVLAQTGGVVEKQRLKGKNWSGDRQLWWRDASVGDQLTVGFEVDEGGWYELDLALVRANDDGIVRVALNDETVAEGVDNYSVDLSSAMFRAGRVRLRAGLNELRFTIVGKHDDALPQYMFGLDYLFARKQ